MYGNNVTVRFEGWCDETGAFFGKDQREPLRPVERNLLSQTWNLYAVYTACVPTVDGAVTELPLAPCILDGKATIGFLRLQRTYMLELPAENYIILPQNQFYRMEWTKDGAVLPTDTVTIRGRMVNRYGLQITLQ